MPAERQKASKCSCEAPSGAEGVWAWKLGSVMSAGSSRRRSAARRILRWAMRRLRVDLGTRDSEESRARSISGAERRKTSLPRVMRLPHSRGEIAEEGVAAHEVIFAVLAEDHVAAGERDELGEMFSLAGGE